MLFETGDDCRRSARDRPWEPGAMNDELQPIAGIARAITKILPQIASLRHDVEGNRQRLTELVDTVNVLLIPKGWVGIDSDGLMHVTYVVPSDDRPRWVDIGGSVPGRPAVLSHHADFLWEYSALHRAVRCVKCRDGSVAEGEVRACDGPVQGSRSQG